MTEQMLTDEELVREELVRLEHATNRLSNALRMLGNRTNESAEYMRRWAKVVDLWRGEIRRGL